MSTKVVKAEPVFERGDEVELEHIDWLWPNRYPLSMVSIMAGLGGASKSTLTLYMAAQITTGRPWIDDPPGTTREPGDVIILSAEDLPGQIIIPRLIAMEADLKRIYILKATKVTLENGQTGIVGLESLEKADSGCGGLDMLNNLVKQCPNPLMVVVDPYTSYMGKTDSNDNILVRGFLKPLGDLAAEHELAVIGITHLNKKEDSSADFRIIGSVGQQNLARMCWLVAQDPDAEDRRYMVWLKGNLGPRPKGLAYRLMNVPVTFKDRTSFYSQVCFEKEPVHLTAQELCAPKPHKGGRPSKQEPVKEWLESFLSEGPVKSDLILSEGKALGFSESTLNRVKKKMGIMAIPIRKPGASNPEYWEWRLPS